MQTSTTIKKFSLRVYGVVIDKQNCILISDELIKGRDISKFPGGAVEFGEGIREALVREFLEETQTPVEVLEHIYTTDFFVQSTFSAESQVIAVYYRVEPLQPFKFSPKDIPFQYDETHEGGLQAFRWVPLSKLHPKDMTFITEQIVITILQNQHL